MKVIDKVTRRKHAACPVLGGYQVCLIPNMGWEDATISNVCAFTDEQFFDRFEVVE